MWQHTGQQRPRFADTPAPGQESVWDYPRPPALVPCNSLVEVRHHDAVIACTRRALRILETASPPAYYLPPEDVDWSQLLRTTHHSWCEWKGRASYWTLADFRGALPVAWAYENPVEHFADIDGHVSFYPGRIACFVDGERVQPQPGDFYGGWITSGVSGPFKGEPGTGHW